MRSQQPVVDEKNPFYCPALDAVAFLQTLRHQIHSSPPPYSRSPGDCLPSFAECLDKSLDEAELHSLLYRAVPRALDSPNASSLDFSGFFCDQSTPAPQRGQATPSAPGIKAKRKRPSSPETFSDLLAPAKREKSFQSVNEGSFELSSRAEKLRYFRGSQDALFSPYAPRSYGYSDADGRPTAFELERKIRVLEDELYGPPVGAETPRSMNALAMRLDALLPGIRLKERLRALNADSHQHIADILALDGHLNARMLEMLRMSEIEVLDLTASLMEAEGLNLGARELLPVFNKPNSFLFLSELSLSDACLQDFDMTYIHHLPRLSHLWLSNTGIGNEAVYHLVALRRTLSELDLSLNAAVDDDVVPALLALPKLSFVSLFDTGVRMPGLRRLANGIAERALAGGSDVLDIEVPRECEEYLDSTYMLHPEPPLVIDPAACMDLSISALRRNLAAHAAYNAQIVQGGSREEMVERLERVLRTREEDLKVREMVWQAAEKAVVGDMVKQEEGSAGELETICNVRATVSCNILLLRGQIEIQPQERTTVSYDYLARLLGEYLLTATPGEDTSAALSVMPFTRSAKHKRPLTRPSEGMDLNPLFTGTTAFRPAGEGGELKLFEHAGIKLVHGWLSDPDSPEYQLLSATQDYDTAVNLIVEADHLTKGRLLAPESASVEAEASGSSSGSYSALSHDERQKVQDAIIIRDFINKTQSQLTYYGLFTLASTVEPGQLVALFRNSHLSVLYKPHGQDGGLYTLATDQVFLNEASVVWERLEDVEGGMSSFVDSDFIRSSPAGGDYAGHTAESALAALEAQTADLTFEERGECVCSRLAELARQLQAEEDERAHQLREARRARERARQELTDSGQHVPASTDDRKRKKKGDCIIM
ncbi:hypothetical protein DAEQUDRAFT_662157 [Daedalea quercina L-15889]|uniref:MINDY deubiquitinase domain-containing protein n=1 Tax=Daedalea quercina L-15889 TaxID=1314783 RepID=A0A165TJT8_9APHY|nr:hypothetical protein DAEQUDRAFT_662157 [Daedalea quercina L-15889]